MLAADRERAGTRLRQICGIVITFQITKNADFLRTSSIPSIHRSRKKEKCRGQKKSKSHIRLIGSNAAERIVAFEAAFFSTRNSPNLHDKPDRWSRSHLSKVDFKTLHLYTGAQACFGMSSSYFGFRKACPKRKKRQQRAAKRATHQVLGQVHFHTTTPHHTIVRPTQHGDDLS